MLRGFVAAIAASLMGIGLSCNALAQAPRPSSQGTPSLVDVARDFALAQDKGSGGWAAFSKARSVQWAPGSDIQMDGLQARAGRVALGQAGVADVMVMGEKGSLQMINVQIQAGQGRTFGRSGFATALSTHLPGINPVQVRGACPDEADGMPSAVYRVQLPGAGQAHVMVFSVIEPGQTQPLASGFSFSRKYEHDWLCDHDHGPGSDHRH